MSGLAQQKPDGAAGSTGWLEGFDWRVLLERDAVLTVGAVLGALVAGLAVHGVVFWLLRRVARRVRAIDADELRRLRGPSRLLFATLSILLFTSAFPGGEEGLPGALRHVVVLVDIAAVVWLIVALLDVLEAEVKRRHDVAVTDNLEARRLHTQITVLRRTLVVLVVVLGLSAALMTFPRVRALGQSLLASAGIAGLAIGLAARPVLENLVSGLQLAFTQPVRLDDVVIIDGEWGRVEEITAAYVVVKIWDERRLVVPFSKFLSDSFQNWTRTSAEILGTVMIHADYTVPVEAVRRELQRVVEGHPEWDGRVCVLQVTDATERSVQLRALVSAADASRGWNLRVHVREKLIEFLQREHPGCLPRARLELDRPEPAAS